MHRFLHEESEHSERKLHGNDELPSITYPYRKMVVGDYLHKILLLCALLWINENTESDSSIFIRSVIFFLASLLIKKVIYQTDKTRLERAAIQEVQQNNAIENKLIIPAWSEQRLLIPIMPIDWLDVLMDLILYGPLFIRLSGVIPFSGLYTLKKPLYFSDGIKILCLLFSIGYDGIANRAIMKSNDQHSQKFYRQLIKNEGNKPGKVIRELLDNFFPDEKTRWKSTHELVCGCQTLTFTPNPTWRKNPEKLSTLWIMKKLLHYHFDTEFKMEDYPQRLSFFLPRLNFRVKDKIPLIKAQITQIQPMIRTLQKIHPEIKPSQWEIIEDQDHPTAKYKPVYVYIKSKLSFPTQTYEAIKTRFKWKESSKFGTVLYEILPIKDRVEEKKEIFPNSFSLPLENPSAPPQKNNPPPPKSQRSALIEKMNLIKQLIPAQAILTPDKEENTCLRVKMPVGELEKKLSSLKNVKIEKSHNGSCLFLQFSEGIEIRIIGELKKYKKKATHRPKKTVSRQKKSETKIAVSVVHKVEEKTKINEKKSVSATREYTGKSLAPVNKALSGKAIHDIINIIALEFKKLAGEIDDFSNSKNTTYILLSQFIQLSYAVKNINKAISIRAFGGIWRSLLMRETPNDVDIVVSVPSGFRPTEDLLEPLLRQGIITEYRLSQKTDILLYTICFLGHILQITFFPSPSIEDHARTLDFTVNTLELEIKQFHTPLSACLYLPQYSHAFVSAIQNDMKPTIDVVINPDYLSLLKNARIRTVLTTGITAFFPEWTWLLTKTVIQTLLDSPKNFLLIEPRRLVLFILKLLSFIYDPKRIFRLLSLHQSNHYLIAEDLSEQILMHFIAYLFNAVVTVEENLSSPELSRSQLFFYLREYLTKQITRKKTQEPLVSYVKITQLVLEAGTAYSETKQPTYVETLNKVNWIFGDPAILQYLLSQFQNSPDRTQEALLQALTLTQAPQFFATLHYHPDPTTLTQCYLLPAFHKQFAVNAGLFHYTPPQEPSERKEDGLDETLFNQWQRYSAGRYHSNACHLFHHPLPRQATQDHSMENNPLYEYK